MLDFILLFILVISILLGVLRGAIKEIFNIIGLTISIMITLYHYDIFLKLFQVSPGLFVNIVSAIGVFTVSLIIIMLINAWITYCLTPIRLNIIDRFFGSFVGLIKGIAFSFILFVFINVFYYSLYYNVEDQKKHNDDPYYYLPGWVKNAVGYNLLVNVDKNINQLIPDSVRDNIKEFGESFENKLKNDEKKRETKHKT